MPRSVLHVLLAILLLVLQQMSQLHGLSHRDQSGEAPGLRALVLPDLDGSGMPEALSDLCSDCAASAKLAFALPAGTYAFARVEAAADAVPAPDGAGICQRTTCPFQSRGPPRA